MDIQGFFLHPTRFPIAGYQKQLLCCQLFDKLPRFPLANISLTRDDERTLNPVLHDGRKTIFIAKIVEVVAGR